MNDTPTPAAPLTPPAPAAPAQAAPASPPAPAPPVPPVLPPSGLATSPTTQPGSFAGKIDELGSEFVTGEEWGLFGGAENNPDSLKTKIIENLGKARAAIATNDLTTQQTAFLEAKDAFSEAQRRRPIWYLANTQFGLLPLLFTMCSGALTYGFVFRRFMDMPTDAIIRSAAFWGLSGAILKALYWMQFQINKGVLRPRWLAYFLVAPPIGILLGAISNLIVKVGFKLVHEGKDTTLDWRVIALFAAFAGFNWEWALEKFRYGADAVASLASNKGTGGAAKPSK
jgi:hypothetical protein